MNPLIASTLIALSFLPTYQEGLQAYDNKQYVESANHFEKLVYNRVYEAEVFHNLGNAYYRMGYLGPAIVNYERALRLDPALEAPQHNLRMAISQTKRAMGRPGGDGLEQSLFFWHESWAPSRSRTVTLVFWTLAWIALITRIIRPLPYLRRTAVACFLLSIIFAGSWWYKTNPAELAVANGDKIPVHYGPKSSDTVHFELFEGDRVAIDEHREEWVRVTASDGSRGWTQREYLLMVWPPRDSGIEDRIRGDAL